MTTTTTDLFHQLYAAMGAEDCEERVQPIVDELRARGSVSVMLAFGVCLQRALTHADVNRWEFLLGFFPESVQDFGRRMASFRRANFSGYAGTA